MGIFDRMGRVISSNVNALLDKAEDPRKSIELVVAEMREQIALAKKEVASSMATEKQLERKVAELDGEAEKWGKRAELALKADDESLAREALVQKKRVVTDRDRAEGLLAEARGSTLRSRTDLKRMEAKLVEVDARKGIIAAQVQQAKAGGGSESLGAKGGSSAFDEFRKIEDQLERAEAEVAAGREVDEALSGKPGGRKEDLEAKFAALEHGGGGTGKGGVEIDDELAALKRKVRIKS
jgi:phage shock protein A